MGWFIFILACVRTTAAPDGPRPPDDTPNDTASDVLPPETGEPDPADPPDVARVRWMLHGGGPEDDDVFRTFVQAANNGHIVTLGALDDGDPGVLAWDAYWTNLGAASATTVNTADAADGDDPALVARVRTADALFLRGGDQAAYVERWFGHALGEAIVEAFERGAVIGGSSAGCAVLGERIYDAREGSVAAWEVLRDGKDPWLTFTHNPGFGVQGIITDTHVSERGRLPRLAVMLAHQQLDLPDRAWTALGLDAQTALFLREDRTGFVVGEGAVTLLRGGDARLRAGAPPDIRAMRLWSLPAGYSLSLDAVDPVLLRPDWVVPNAPGLAGNFGETDLDGDWLGTHAVGRWVVEPWSDPYALLDGQLQLVDGEGVLPDVLVGARVWSDEETVETRLGGLLWGTAAGDGRIAVALDEGMFAMSLEPRLLAVGPGSAVLTLDARTAAHRGTRSTGWQVGALEHAALSIVTDLEPLDLR
jgi:cyanophycinase-like exopeptidase